MTVRPPTTLVLLLVCGVAAGAQEPAPVAVAAEEDASPRDRVRRVEEQFDTELPSTIGRRRLQFSLRPRWEDLVEEDYIRVPLELRRGFGEDTEAWAGLVPFLESPFGSGENSRSGPGELFVGVKRSLRSGAGRDDVTAGVRATLPLGRPPARYSDWAHLVPFAVWSHLHGREIGLLSYVNLSADLAESPPGKRRPSSDRPRHRVLLRPGFLLQRERWRYSFEVEWSTDRFDGGDRSEVFVEPGVTWTPPGGFGRNAYLKDRFEVGAYLRVGVHDTEDDLSGGGEVRVRFDRRRWWQERRGPGQGGSAVGRSDRRP